MKRQIDSLLVIAALTGLICFINGDSVGDEAADAKKPETQAEEPETWLANISSSILTIDDGTVTVRPEANPLRNAYFGDLHLHTTYSFDAFANGTLTTPYDAYRYAKGEAIKHPGGFDIQLRQPLDFLAVTDHSEFLGLMPAVADTSTALSEFEIYEPIHDMNASEYASYWLLPQAVQGMVDGLDIMKRLQVLSTFFPKTAEGIQDGTLDRKMIEEVARSAWADTIEAAEEHNAPGRFTTLIGYEYTSTTDERGNLHRNVIFRGDSRVPAIPFSRFHSRNPEGLWDWMDGLREQGIESLAIPHNSNGSNGQMFRFTDWAGDPMDDEYVDQRRRNEPLVEITQVKGCSDTHPALSTTDEWAGFEIMPYRVATQLPSEPPGSYVRDALQRGLAMEDKDGSNPYKFGFIGSSDTHIGATSDDESNHFGAGALMDMDGILRGSIPMPNAQAWVARRIGAEKYLVSDGGVTYTKGATETFGTAGLAGVWAEENTREAIYNAFRRKETFATSGPRIRVRFVAGYDYDENLLNEHDIVAKAYAGGVPMGSDLLPREGATPRFLVWAMRDAESASLQRVQIIKGWIADGTPNEKVYDVACSDGLEVDPRTRRCPDNSAKVNLKDCSITAGVGNAELKALWTDPDFDPNQRAFYYVRVLENPTCRWSTWDAVRAGVEPRSDLKKTIQERAWSSPIWYTP